MKHINYQELISIAHNENSITLKDVARFLKENTGIYQDEEYESYNYEQSERKKVREIAYKIGNEPITVFGDSNDYHNLAIDYVNLNMFDCAMRILIRGLKDSPYDTNLLADTILYGMESGQYRECEKALARLLRIDKPVWGWRAYSFTIDYYMDKLKRLPRGKKWNELRDKTLDLVEEYVSYANQHPDEAADKAYFRKALALKELGAEADYERILVKGRDLTMVGSQCALRLADMCFDSGRYSDALENLKKCVASVLRVQPDVNPSYVYLLNAMAKTAIIIRDKAVGESAPSPDATDSAYRDYHSALAYAGTDPLFSDAAKKAIRLLEVQTGTKDTVSSNEEENYI